MGSIPRNLPILREPGADPCHSSDRGPCGREKNGVLRCQKVKIIEKSRAARARETFSDDKNQNFTVDNAKIEDPAKMTYSIPDFLSRNEINPPISCQYLERRSPITKINT